MPSVCTVEVHVAVNNMEILNVAQQCFYGDFVFPPQQKPFLRSSCKAPDFFVQTINTSGVSR